MTAYEAQHIDALNRINNTLLKILTRMESDAKKAPEQGEAVKKKAVGGTKKIGSFG